MGFLAPIIDWATTTWLGKTVTSFAMGYLTNKLFGLKAPKTQSPTYGFSTATTTTTNTAVMQMVYGKVKCAGNVIWTSGEGQTQSKLVGFGFGKIKGFENIRLNNVLINSSPAFTIKYTTANVQYTSGIIQLIRGAYSYSNNVFTLAEGMYFFNKFTPSSSKTFDCTNKTIADLVAWINQQPNWSATNSNTVDLGDLKTVSQVFCDSATNVNLNTLSGVTYSAYLGDGVQEIDSRVTGSTQEEKAKLVGGLKYDAYLAFTATASDQLSGDYNVTTEVLGRIVKIYSSETEYTEAWSDNPAWCILDFMTHPNGCGISIDKINIQSFINAGKYFDTVLANGQKRFTLNLVLDETKSRQDWLQEMMITCMSYEIYQNGKHGILVEKTEDISQVFDIEPDEEVEFWTSEIDDEYERLKILYIDPSYEWAKVTAIAEADTFKYETPIEKNIEIYGITNFDQASRLSWFYLNQAQTCKTWCRYKTNKKAVNRTIGDVVATNDPVLELQNKKWRIMSISESQSGSIELTMREYNEALYCDERGSAEPVANVTKLANPYTIPAEVYNLVLSQTYYLQSDGTVISYISGTFDLPDSNQIGSMIVEYSEDDGAIWNYSSTVSEGKFRIDNVKTKQTYKVRIKTVNKMGLVSSGFVSESIYVTGKDTAPTNIANITATQDISNVTKINLVWDKVNDIDLKNYRLFENGIEVANVTDTKYQYTATESRTYNFSVVAVDNGNNPSAIPASISIDIKVEPDDVTNLTAVQLDTDRSQLILNWNGGKNVDHYILKMIDNSGVETVIKNDIKSNNYQYTLQNEGVFSFAVLAVNSADFKSINPALILKQIILKPSSPASGTTTQDINDRSFIKLSWDRVNEKDISKYVLYDATGKEIDRIADTNYRYKVSKSGIYTFSIKSVNVAGYYSNALNLAITVSIEPLDVTGFTAIQNMNDRSKITLFWDATNELDIAYRIIKKGNSWEDSTVIEPRVYGTSYDLQVFEEVEQKFWIKAVSVAGVESQFPASVDSIYSLNPSTPSNLIVSQNVNDRSEINISWKGISETDFKEYELNIDDEAKTIITTKETKATYYPKKSGNYTFRLKAKNNSNFYSDEIFTSVNIVLEPSTVKNFQASQNGEYVELSWDISEDADVVDSFIVEGNTFDSGTEIISGWTSNHYEVKVDTEKTYTYHIKVRNKSNHYSALASTVQLPVRNLPPKNVILSFDEIALKSGTATNVEFGTSMINASNFGGKASDYPNIKCSEVGGQTVLKLAKQADETYCSNGEYQCATKDVGQIITANIATLFYSTNSFENGGNAKLQFRTSQDNTNWTAWNDFKPALVTFRYCQFKVVFVTLNTLTTPEVNQLKINIDVPDTMKTATATIPVGGLTISYGNTFWTNPAVICHAIGVGLHTEISAVTKTNFTVKVLNTANSDVGGTISYQAIGY